MTEAMIETVTIERLGHLGDGVAGGVFVPRALPGEVVEGEVAAGRMAMPRILTPSPDRVRPPCPHYKRCGGCALQHAADDFVARWKAEVVRTALAAHDLPAPIRRVSTSPPRSRRRATLTGRRTKSGTEIGFHARGSDQIVDAPDCQLVLPQIADLRPCLAELTLAGASRKAPVRLFVTWSEAGGDVAVSGAKPLDAALTEQITAIAARHDLARLTWNEETIFAARPPIQRMDGIAVVPPPGAFLQATAEGEKALFQAVSETVSDAVSVVDLFSGCGTFSLPLARTARVHAVEGDAALLGALDHGWRHGQGLRQVTTEARDLYRRPLLAPELDRFGAAVIDPPRAGAAAQCAEIARSGLNRVAMVSCNPVTFARDAAALAAAGFALDFIDVVDQFRWSPHVELAAAFRR